MDGNLKEQRETGREEEWSERTGGISKNAMPRRKEKREKEARQEKCRKTEGKHAEGRK